MSHRIPAIAFAVIVFAASLGSDVRAGAAASGRVLGIVRDGTGLAIADADILAVGQTIVSSRSDVRGRFQILLPPGNYVLKAARIGYVSTYREPVRVDSTTRLERTITLTRQSDSPFAIPNDAHSHTDLAWQLRHLPRSVLRDEGATSGAGGKTTTPSQDNRSTRWAFLDQEFTGQVNLLTTASTNPFSAEHAAATPRGVAFIVVGAPVGVTGDWRVRGAIGSGDGSSWNLLGEYDSRDFAGHAATFGVSYSAQQYQSPVTGLVVTTALPDARRVAGAFARDRWRVTPRLNLSYAVRADRYDYLQVPNLYSGNAEVRALLLPRTYLEGSASRNLLAPGAEEFLPPPADGPWLPPERTFSSLFGARDVMRAEDVQHLEVGFAREFGRDAFSRTIRVRAFRQQTTDQMVTLFGSRKSSDLGHYRVAQAGEVQVDGWSAGIDGVIVGSLSGAIEYSHLFADWRATGRTRGLRLVAPSMLRPDAERVHDVLASLDAAFNNSRTRIQVVYRYSSAFSSDEGGRVPVPGSRFDLQMHQELPYRPAGDGRVELIFAVRTLFRDVHSGASFYDELLTVRPPTRFMGGIQVRF
jgi:hypothetical protein